MLTAFGASAVTFMVLMYALERRNRYFILAFACGCALSSAYGFPCRHLAIRRSRGGLDDHRSPPRLPLPSGRPRKEKPR